MIEPGGMRTAWTGSSMRVDSIRSEYQSTVGASAAMHGSRSLPPTTPIRWRVWWSNLIKLGKPPLRLLVGPEACTYATAAARAQLAQDEQWRELSESSVADDVTPEQIDPMRRSEVEISQPGQGSRSSS